MASISFLSLTQASPEHLIEIKDIFFEASARRDFSSVTEKEEFYEKYLGIYLKEFPSYGFYFLHEEKVGGYIVGAPSTLDHLSLFSSALPYLELFKEFFESYPAHLHINLSSVVRGMGFGSLLLAHFEQHLKHQKIDGVHLITAKTARNVHFYEQNGYSFRVQRVFGERVLLLLGKSLTHS